MFLILKTRDTNVAVAQDALQWINLSTSKVTTLWPVNESRNSQVIGNYCFDSKGTQCAFLLLKILAIPVLRNTLWHYREGKGKATSKVGQQFLRFRQNYMIDPSAPSFNVPR